MSIFKFIKRKKSDKIVYTLDGYREDVEYSEEVVEALKEHNTIQIIDEKCTTKK